MSKKAALLLNLGSPDSPSVADVRKYLAEFLYDERVLDSPTPIRWTVLNLFILPFRPKKSAHAYEKVWTPEGAPLVVTSKKQQALTQQKTTVPVALAMRYGQPKVRDVLAKLIADGVDDLFIMPLYPHYAMSSYETVLVQVQEEIARQKPGMKYTILQPFYNDPEYITAMVENARPYLEKPFDKLLFSFHGLPERHLRKADSSKGHCTIVPNCCDVCHPAHATCYKHQCMTTARLFVEKAGLKPEQWTHAFQSRLVGEPWLTPFTDKVIAEFADQGMKRLLVICPAFVTDCLETLEEIAMGNAEIFVEHGGETLTLIPCLNEHPLWIEWLARRINQWAQA
ncbi:MAG: ferrochelatase [Verrucomicrobiota bacterium]|nr:ferrochelatase [Verrucomicrobiota bacterium]